MITIGLVRHGITDWNVRGKAQGITDIPLNEEGKKQALQLGERLVLEEQWDVIVSSDLSRASETARIIGEKLNVPVDHYDQRLREKDFGIIQGTTEEERLVTWGENWRELDLGAEPMEAVAARGIACLNDLAGTYQNKRILVVSHGALIGSTLEGLFPGKFKETKMGNTSLTILDKIQGEWNCSLYNCTTHLNQQKEVKA
ncbi:histidine phosphatase family protein [Virgibacillus halodenitrificans]|uniref:Histidine phosphatase family protein n=1 Tax=Virgibacillus halodenitrificans TaxID=1482 RepID=A0ABR7VS62_VIRHA|nr:histidine phosphatase family protein [Virgibacillus halodenitrificans]MBD1224727.1 histidine phosphatase family protein [Virgibacillus halodenitrificans]